jgi:hypothetical protein
MVCYALIVTAQKKTIIRLRYAEAGETPARVCDVKQTSPAVKGVEFTVWDAAGNTLHWITFRDYEVWRLNIQRPSEFILLDRVWVRAEKVLQELEDVGVLHRVGGRKATEGVAGTSGSSAAFV